MATTNDDTVNGDIVKAHEALTRLDELSSCLSGTSRYLLNAQIECLRMLDPDRVVEGRNGVVIQYLDLAHAEGQLEAKHVILGSHLITQQMLFAEGLLAYEQTKNQKELAIAVEAFVRGVLSTLWETLRDKCDGSTQATIAKGLVEGFLKHSPSLIERFVRW